MWFSGFRLSIISNRKRPGYRQLYKILTNRCLYISWCQGTRSKIHNYLTDNLQDMVKGTSLFSNNLFFKPFLITTAKNYQTIDLFIHQASCAVLKFLQFHLRDLSFKYGVLNPMKVFPAKFQHFTHPLFSYIIYKDNIHPDKL